ncbi:MAG: glycosyltransferase WbuB, partial [Bdellovibrionota bacterium]
IFASVVPSKIQSYMASGRPIVASLDGEGARVVEAAGAGKVGPAEDVEALAANVLSMYESSEQRRREMGQGARDYYQKHFLRRDLIDRIQRCLERFPQKKSGS